MTNASTHWQTRIHPLKTSRRWQFLLALPLLFITACSNPSTSANAGLSKYVPPANLGVEPGKKALEIAGTDVFGKKFQLSQFEGKVVLLDFWATWCGPCRQLIPHEKKLVAKYEGQPFAILGISNDSRKDDLKRFLDRDKLPWPNLLDTEGSIVSQWHISGLPTLVLIDPKGTIVERWEGGGQMDEIEIAIAATVKKAGEAGQN